MILALAGVLLAQAENCHCNEPGSKSTSQIAARQMENLGRGVVAVRKEDGVFVSWRLLGNEARDKAFNLYRAFNGATQKLNAQPLTGGTNFEDKTAPPGAVSYFVRPVVNSNEEAAGRSFILPDGPAKPYFSVPLQTPQGYAPNDGSVGDLDGDGEYEIVLHQAGRGKDNSQGGQT